MFLHLKQGPKRCKEVDSARVDLSWSPKYRPRQVLFSTHLAHKMLKQGYETQKIHDRKDVLAGQISSFSKDEHSVSHREHKGTSARGYNV